MYTLRKFLETHLTQVKKEPTIDLSKMNFADSESRILAHLGLGDVTLAMSQSHRRLCEAIDAANASGYTDLAADLDRVARPPQAGSRPRALFRLLTERTTAMTDLETAFAILAEQRSLMSPRDLLLTRARAIMWKLRQLDRWERVNRKVRG